MHRLGATRAIFLPLDERAVDIGEPSVFDDIYLRFDARQEFGAWATRAWSAGIEF